MKKASTKSTKPENDLSSLPEGWKWKTINDVAQFLRGVSYKKEDARELSKGGLIPILRATNIQEEKLILDSDLVYIPSEYIKEVQYLNQGDIIVCMSSGSKHLVGKTAQLSQKWKGSFGTFCAAIRPNPMINKNFLGYFFSTPKYKNFIREKSSGININNLKPSDFEALKIPFPPIPEQERIVARLEELLSDLDAGVAALERVRAGVKRYKASVLKAACEGRLFGDVKLMEDGRPEGWRWVLVNELSDGSKHALKAGPFGSSLKKEFYVRKGYKIYGQEQVLRGDPNYGDYYITHERFESLKTNVVKPGDILISLVGTIGRVLILPEDIEPGIINPRLVKLSLDQKIIFNKYFQIYFNSEIAKRYFSTVSHGETMEILNLNIIKNFPIALPSIAEQKRIVMEVEERMESISNIEKTIELGDRRASRLRQAILKSAFEGKLQ